MNIYNCKNIKDYRILRRELCLRSIVFLIFATVHCTQEAFDTANPAKVRTFSRFTVRPLDTVYKVVHHEQMKNSDALMAVYNTVTRTPDLS